MTTDPARLAPTGTRNASGDPPHHDLSGKTPFEHDIADQADALRALAHSDALSRPLDLLQRSYGRIILTGMGSSHFVGLPTWRQLVAAGRPTWWVDSGQLLDSPELVTADTLLIATSQSGASGEVVALLDHLTGARRPSAVIGLTNDTTSPLAERADEIIALHSGNEATVSTKSYLNSLVAHHHLGCLVSGNTAEDLEEVIKAVDSVTTAAQLSELAAAFAKSPNSRIAFVGFGSHAATALYAGLITKEAAKVPAEGYIGGQFRHGPLELAGPGLTAVLFAGDRGGQDSLRQLATDLLASGSTVLSIGRLGVAGAIELLPQGAGQLAQLATAAVVAQHLTVELARARHITPGAFGYGSKVTTAL